MSNGFIEMNENDFPLIPVDIEKVDEEARYIGTYLTVKNGKYVKACENDLIYGVMWHGNTIAIKGVVGERKYL